MPSAPALIPPLDGQALRALRIRRGLTLAELARRTGHHQKAIANLEQNRRGASRVMVVHLAEALGIDPDEMPRCEDGEDEGTAA